MYEWCMNDVHVAQPPKIVIVLSVLQNWNKIVNQSINPQEVTFYMQGGQTINIASNMSQFAQLVTPE